MHENMALDEGPKPWHQSRKDNALAWLLAIAPATDPLSESPALEPHCLTPIQRVRPTPWVFWLVQMIARPDKIIRRNDVVGRIRDDAPPSIAARTRLHATHQPQLQCAAGVPLQHADPAKIPGVADMCRRNQPGKADGQAIIVCQPPMPNVEFGNGSASKESQPV
jgi:hypothetical protein